MHATAGSHRLLRTRYPGAAFKSRRRPTSASADVAGLLPNEGLSQQGENENTKVCPDGRKIYPVTASRSCFSLSLPMKGG